MQCHVLIFVCEGVEWVGGINIANINKKVIFCDQFFFFFSLSFFSRSTIVEPEQKFEKNLAGEVS